VQQHRPALDQFAAIAVRRQAALEQLDRQALLDVREHHRRFAKTFPREQEVERALSTASAPRAYRFARRI